MFLTFSVIIVLVNCHREFVNPISFKKSFFIIIIFPICRRLWVCIISLRVFCPLDTFMWRGYVFLLLLSHLNEFGRLIVFASFLIKSPKRVWETYYFLYRFLLLSHLIVFILFLIIKSPKRVFGDLISPWPTKLAKGNI